MTPRLGQRISLLVLTTVLGLSSAAWTAEGEAVGEVLRDFLAKSFAAGNNCARMAVKMDDWFEVSGEEAQAKTAALVAEVTSLSDPIELDKVDDFIDETLSDALGADVEKTTAFANCIDENADVAAHVENFDATVVGPVKAAVLERREAIAAAAAATASRADLELAMLAAQTHTRLLRLYRETVEHYGPEGCTSLARAHDFWYGNYIEAFDSSADSLMVEMQRMSPNEYVGFEEALATVEGDKAALETSRACIDELEGDDKDYLEKQVRNLGMIVELVALSAPPEP